MLRRSWHSSHRKSQTAFDRRELLCKTTCELRSNGPLTTWTWIGIECLACKFSLNHEFLNSDPIKAPQQSSNSLSITCSGISLLYRPIILLSPT